MIESAGCPAGIAALFKHGSETAFAVNGYGKWANVITEVVRYTAYLKGILLGQPVLKTLNTELIMHAEWALTECSRQGGEWVSRLLLLEVGGQQEVRESVH